MHNVDVRKEITERVLKRRNRYHLFDTLDPKRSVFVVVDMQNMFCEPGAPAEVSASRGIVGNINRLARELRQMGGKIVWISSAADSDGTGSSWSMFLDNFVAAGVRERTAEYMKPGGHGQKLWKDLEVGDKDFHVTKNRYSCFTPGSSSLERLLRSYKIENVLIGGTKTNICCESTARDSMQLDFKTVMISDANAALSDDEHRAALENVIQQFGDVMTTDETIAVLQKKPN